MKNYKSRTLQKELLVAGAQSSEASELTIIAHKLSLLRKPGMTDSRKPLWLRAVPLGMTAILFLAVGATLIIFSQAAMPGSLLYPVQKLADSAAIDFHPAYRGNVMMKRASQVEWLVSHHGSQAKVLATLADYQTVAAGYQSAGSDNYEVLDFCESNLKQAAGMSMGTTKQAILQTLNELKSA